MSHEIENNEFAYVGEKAWHELGTALDDDSTLEEWTEKAGFGWTAKTSRVCFNAEGKDEQGEITDRFVVYRSDNHKPLGVVSSRYNVVQPAEAMEFFREVTRKGNFKMECAGMLYGGKKFWALAKVAEGRDIGGGDIINPYVLMATSLDCSMPTVVHMTTIRVVCENTLTAAVGSKGECADVRVSHRTKFQVESALRQLEERHQMFDVFIDSAQRLAETRISKNDAIFSLAEIIKKTEEQKTVDELLHSSRELKMMVELYDKGQGADLETAKGTCWGVINAATEYAGKYYGRSLDSRFNSNFFGKWNGKTELLANNLLKRTH